MEEDRKKFGKTAFELVGAERYSRYSYDARPLSSLLEPVSSKGLRPVFSLVGLKIWTSVNFGIVSVSSKGASVVED